MGLTSQRRDPPRETLFGKIGILLLDPKRAGKCIAGHERELVRQKGRAFRQ